MFFFANSLNDFNFVLQRSDEDESEPTNRETNEKLLGPEGKKGGATQV